MDKVSQSQIQTLHFRKGQLSRGGIFWVCVCFVDTQANALWAPSDLSGHWSVWQKLLNWVFFFFFFNSFFQVCFFIFHCDGQSEQKKQWEEELFCASNLPFMWMSVCWTGSPKPLAWKPASVPHFLFYLLRFLSSRMLSAVEEALLMFLCFQVSDSLPVNLALQDSCCCHGCDGMGEEDTCRERVGAERLIGWENRRVIPQN